MQIYWPFIRWAAIAQILVILLVFNTPAGYLLGMSKEKDLSHGHSIVYVITTSEVNWFSTYTFFFFSHFVIDLLLCSRLLSYCRTQFELSLSSQTNGPKFLLNI